MNMITAQQIKFLEFALQDQRKADIITRSLAMKRREKITHMTRQEAWECINVIKMLPNA